MNNLLNINNKKNTIQSSTPTPSKMKPNDGYFNNQDRSSYQNIKLMNPLNNSSNLRMNLNNLMSNPNNKHLSYPVSTGNLIGNHDKNNNGNLAFNSKSSNNLNTRDSNNEKNNNLNQVGFVSKFINSYK